MTPKNIAKLNAPLDDDELELLDQFLLNRLDDDVDTEGKDVGVFEISTLDGLLTAIVSGPTTVLMSRWLPSLWGDFPHTWANQDEFEKIVGLIVRHMNSIVGLLMYQPEDFEPIFYERKVKRKTYTIVDEWCEGYLRGIALAEDEWLAGGEDVANLLVPILAFTESNGWPGHELKVRQAEALQEAIAPSARELHAFWLARRTPPASASVPQRRSDPKVGRNDPCPCGSGKKFKHCCLH